MAWPKWLKWIKMFGWIIVPFIAIIAAMRGRSQGRKVGKIVEEAANEIEKIKEAEEKGDAEWLAKDIERRVRR